MAYITRSGTVLLNPNERAGKFAKEIKQKKAYTNDGYRKLNDNGKQIKLTKEQLAFRAGYLAHATDSQKAFKSKHPSYRRKTK